MSLYFGYNLFSSSFFCILTTKSGHFSSSLLIVWHRPLRYGDCHRAAADCDFDCHHTTQTDSQVGDWTPARVQVLRETRFQILKSISLMDSQARRCPPCGHCPGVRAEKGDTGATCSGTEDRSFYLRSQKSQPGNTKTQVRKVFTTTLEDYYIKYALLFQERYFDLINAVSFFEWKMFVLL